MYVRVSVLSLLGLTLEAIEDLSLDPFTTFGLVALNIGVVTIMFKIAYLTQERQGLTESQGIDKVRKHHTE